MKTTTPDTMKFRRLQRRLSLSKSQAVGILELLWIATAKNAMQGDIGKFSNEEIAIECDYEGDSDELVAALLDCGWLDHHDECRLVVHDWCDHCPTHVINNLKRWKKWFIIPPKEDPKETPSDPPKETPMDYPSKPSQAKPSQTTPNHAQPSQAEVCDGGGDAERADFNFLRLGEKQYPDVLRQSFAIASTFGKSIETPEIVWQVAWVGIACGEGVIPGCIEKFKKLKGTKDAIKAPQKWLIGCMNRELKDTGITFDEAVSFVVPHSEVKGLVGCA